MNKNCQNDSTCHYIAYLSRKYSSAPRQKLSQGGVCNQVSLKSSEVISFVAITDSDKKETKEETDN